MAWLWRETPRSSPTLGGCPEPPLGMLGWRERERCGCCSVGREVRGSSLPQPPAAPLRTKAALSLSCLLARYKRALLSSSKSSFQGWPPTPLPGLRPPLLLPASPGWLEPSLAPACPSPSRAAAGSRCGGHPKRLVPFLWLGHQVPPSLGCA